MKINYKILDFLLEKKSDYIERALTRHVTKLRNPNFDIIIIKLYHFREKNRKIEK